jgi:hypothetical protein
MEFNFLATNNLGTSQKLPMGVALVSENGKRR